MDNFGWELMWSLNIRNFNTHPTIWYTGRVAFAPASKLMGFLLLDRSAEEKYLSSVRTCYYLKSGLTDACPLEDLHHQAKSWPAWLLQPPPPRAPLLIGSLPVRRDLITPDWRTQRARAPSALNRGTSGAAMRTFSLPGIISAAPWAMTTGSILTVTLSYCIDSAPHSLEVQPVS